MDLSTAQVGFFDVVVLPCVENFAVVFKGCKPMLRAVLENYKHWTTKAVTTVGEGNSQLPKQLAKLSVHVQGQDSATHPGRIHITLNGLNTTPPQSIAE